MPTGPITRRAYENRFGPELNYLFQGKDDENLVNKCLVMTKHTGLLTGFFTLIDVVGVNEHKGITHALQTVIRYSRPLIGGGLAYMSLTNVAASLRNKNDSTNHMWGGIGWGLVAGAHTRNLQTGVNTAIVMGLFGMAYKEYVLKGLDLIPDLPRAKMNGFSLTHKMDFTLFPERPSYWVRTQEEADEIVRTGSRKMYGRTY